jgi:hypothetical protein
LATLVLALVLAMVTPSAAQGARRITWYVMSSGGGQGSSPHYTLNVTIGQPAAGLAYSTNFRLGSGFWYWVGLPQVVFKHLFLPVVLKGYH